MSTLFSEHNADQAAIKSLLREIRRLHPMAKIFKGEDGKLYLVHSYEELTADQIQEMIASDQAEMARLNADVTLLSSALPADQGQPANGDQNNEQTNNTPVGQGGDAGSDQPAPSDQTQGDQAGQAAPAAPNDQSQVTIPADPNQAPPSDPNMAQPEQPAMPTIL